MDSKISLIKTAKNKSELLKIQIESRLQHAKSLLELGYISKGEEVINKVF
jgi:hypothetical protein